jgi:hypothetical protein
LIHGPDWRISCSNEPIRLKGSGSFPQLFLRSQSPLDFYV